MTATLPDAGRLLRRLPGHTRQVAALHVLHGTLLVALAVQVRAPGTTAALAFLATAALGLGLATWRGRPRDVEEPVTLPQPGPTSRSPAPEPLGRALLDALRRIPGYQRQVEGMEALPAVPGPPAAEGEPWADLARRHPTLAPLLERADLPAPTEDQGRAAEALAAAGWGDHLTLTGPPGSGRWTVCAIAAVGAAGGREHGTVCVTPWHRERAARLRAWLTRAGQDDRVRVLEGEGAVPAPDAILLVERPPEHLGSDPSVGLVVVEGEGAAPPTPAAVQVRLVPEAGSVGRPLELRSWAPEAVVARWRPPLAPGLDAEGHPALLRAPVFDELLWLLPMLADACAARDARPCLGTWIPPRVLDRPRLRILRSRVLERLARRPGRGTAWRWLEPGAPVDREAPLHALVSVDPLPSEEPWLRSMMAPGGLLLCVEAGPAGDEDASVPAAPTGPPEAQLEALAALWEERLGHLSPPPRPLPAVALVPAGRLRCEASYDAASDTIRVAADAPEARRAEALLRGLAEAWQARSGRFDHQRLARSREACRFQEGRLVTRGHRAWVVLRLLYEDRPHGTRWPQEEEHVGLTLLRRLERRLGERRLHEWYAPDSQAGPPTVGAACREVELLDEALGEGPRTRR